MKSNSPNDFMMEKSNEVFNESKRLEELDSYNILDTLTEKEYENITYLASVIAETPIALVSFVAEDRQWFKSHLGYWLLKPNVSIRFAHTP